MAMRPKTEGDPIQPSVDQLKKLLKWYDIQGRGIPPEDFFTHMRKCCVLVPLFLKAGQWHVLLTVRSSRLRSDPSVVAFPGGQRDENDADAARTALREAEEEVGLLESQVEIVARLFPFVAPPDYCISVFVGIIPPDFIPIPCSSEVEEVFDIPLKAFLGKDYTVRETDFYGVRFDVPYFAVPNKPLTVWGLTAFVNVMVAFIAYRIRRNFRFMRNVAHAQYEEKDIFADLKLLFFYCGHRAVLNRKIIPLSNL
ncbi:peroxisomal coenzyme A diphosphatase NUDT7-like [Gigantopelta aegis]|uniref:peroxisomal coenzyme A diphosphatase NUDT7-like n=1 Tax=Gigantopelta aegis TaxID=1735272 RepID=UPI001B88A4DE|nr:peroxisomal coenzyme A diphosphatase NUDT7-like [Gigantopelta aegis]XP_041375123.1 peroxisomal coenzyme A diphosphatase NUDT7-like [Gigantopelta aegis]